jgi:short chain dehydrogenase
MIVTNWTAALLPDLTGRTFIVTGATSGPGKATADAVARAGAHVVLNVRSHAKGQAVAEGIAGDTEVRDLVSSLSSVRGFASSWQGPIDVLINDAGIVQVPKARTADGFGLSFASRGAGSSVVRLAPTCHGDGDHGFLAALVVIATYKGVSGFIGDGSTRWPAVHRLDAAHLSRRSGEGPGEIATANADDNSSPSGSPTGWAHPSAPSVHRNSTTDQQLTSAPKGRTCSATPPADDLHR